LEKEPLMFFILSKTAALLLVPSNLMIGIGLAGVVLLFTRWRRAGTRLMAASIVLLVFVAALPIGTILEHTLETRFPPWDPKRGAPDGVIVLGGAINAVLSADYGTPQLIESGERITAIAKLARDYPNARIVYSGGNGSLLGHGEPESHFVMPLVETFGVPRKRVQIEDRSSNTYKNAEYSKALVKPKPGEHWLLVTSARHMPRAVGCFRRVGFPVEAYPVDWRTRRSLQLGLSRQFGASLSQFDKAVHEWLGLIVYWLTGRTSALFPGPAAAQ
jgi:uncharacterized SAM-binding protein YcdF (DUF218 family)